MLNKNSFLQGELSANISTIIHNDEATNDDRLDREQYAKAFAKLAETCDTPLVIGLYGSWGIGKTSLMKQIQSKIKPEVANTIWFDAWRHQHDESPSIALLHTMIDTLDIKDIGKNYLMKIGNALGAVLLKKIGNVNLKDLNDLKKHYEEYNFQERDSRVRLHEYFYSLLEKAQTSKSKNKRRIIFFIDDLDRCMPSQILNILESLKLYLNQPECVYFLGVDRQVLENGIRYHYKDLDLSETSYLDKIVQLPFTIPPIPPEAMEKFVAPLLSKELKNCQSILVKGLGDNPRQIKRFINILTFNNQLASNMNIPNYDPAVLATLLLIQYRNLPLYRLIMKQPTLLYKLKRETEDTKPLFDEYLSKDERLKDTLSIINVPNSISLDSYIYLTQAVRVYEENIEKENKDIQHDTLLAEAANMVVRYQQGSVSLIQRRLKIGYARASRLIEKMEDLGIVGPFNGSKAREVLVTEEELEQLNL